MPATARLLVVSNRAPVELVRGPEGPRPVRTVGGLAGTLDGALRARGGRWIAWVGPHAGAEVPASASGLGYPIRAVRLKEREVSNYYTGFSNQVLWPLSHSFPSRCRRRRMRALGRRVAERDLGWWTATFLDLLAAAGAPAASAA